MVTPTVIKPSSVSPQLPDYPKPFLDEGKFDGKNSDSSQAKK
jgi:hypothetical protein